MAPKKEPKFSSVKWAKSSYEEGEEIEVTANVQDIADGNMVTLHKKAIYFGDKATLKIKTFELSDERPACKLQLWEKDYISEDDFIPAQRKFQLCPSSQNTKI